MNIALISPRSRQGRSTIAVMLGQALARTTPMSTIVTHLGAKSSIPDYIDAKDLLEDSTRSISQLARIADQGNLTVEDIKEFAITVDSTCKFLSTATPETKLRDGVKVIESLMTLEDYRGFNIIDIGTEIYEESTQFVFKHADIVIFVSDQTASGVETFERIMASEYAPDPEKICMIISGFDPLVSPLKSTLSAYGVKRQRGTKLSYNPAIIKASNSGHLETLTYRAHLEDDPKLILLKTELLEMVKLIGANLGFKPKWNDLSVKS